MQCPMWVEPVTDPNAKVVRRADLEAWKQAVLGWDK